MEARSDEVEELIPHAERRSTLLKLARAIPPVNIHGSRRRLDRKMQMNSLKWNIMLY